ncbi:Uma2 family endonuclease [Spirosoma arcticum]
MIAEQSDKRIYTVDEYLELEKNSGVKHEFIDGYLIEIAGESLVANEIAGNLLAMLKSLLRGQPYKVYIQDVKLLTKAAEKYRYPDVMVRSSTGMADSHMVYQAVLTAEVTSENSLKTDTHDKLIEYSSMPSMQCYLIISQAEPLVEVYQRTGSKWEYTFYTSLTDSFEVVALGITLQLSDVYEGVF